MNQRRFWNGPFLVVWDLLILQAVVIAQTGSIHEPIRYVGGATVHHPSHDGQLRPAVGVESFQVMRANRTHPEQSDKFGWTYNHAPMIAYWNDRFFVQYLSNPVGEHIAPGQTFVCTSADGRNWEAPQVAFPIYQLQPPDPPGTAMMHQRMGFYVAPNGRLLILGFYGHAPDPFGKGGIGRVVREVTKEGTFGPIYFLRYNAASGWGESNTGFPHYQRSTDNEFLQACESLLANRLMREQFWDEERLNDEFFSVKGNGRREAFNWYRRKDGKVVGLWKHSLAALSSDQGETWSEPVNVPTLQMTGAKFSGRKTSDGNYALLYNPNGDDDHRWPLAIVTGEDGILFDNMLCVQGEVPPRRFHGKYKDFGPQYNRLVEEGNGSTPGTDLWVTYSMNKEDMWVSRIPVPVRQNVNEPVFDSFDDMKVRGTVNDWNIYSPRWAPVGVVEFPDVTNKCLELKDKDPYDYARAVRVFPEAKSAAVGFSVHAKQNNVGRLEIDVTDRFGYRPVRLIFAEDGQIKVVNGAQTIDLAPYQPGNWYKFSLQIDVDNSRFHVQLGGKTISAFVAFAEYVKSVERISIRTGPAREEPTLKTSTETAPDRTNPNPDEPEPLTLFYVDDVGIKNH